MVYWCGTSWPFLWRNLLTTTCTRIFRNKVIPKNFLTSWKHFALKSDSKCCRITVKNITIGSHYEIVNFSFSFNSPSLLTDERARITPPRTFGPNDSSTGLLTTSLCRNTIRILERPLNYRLSCVIKNASKRYNWSSLHFGQSSSPMAIFPRSGC